MSWVDDAKKHAEKLNKDREEQIRSYELTKIDRKNPSPKRHLFLINLLRNSGIEAALCKATSNGLSVTVMQEGFKINGPGRLFSYDEGGTGDAMYDELIGNRITTYNYCISWMVCEPTTKSNIVIELGFNLIYNQITIRDSLFKSHKEKVIVDYEPTRTSQEIEKLIKDWLIEVFSK